MLTDLLPHVFSLSPTHTLSTHYALDLVCLFTDISQFLAQGPSNKYALEEWMVYFYIIL